MGNGFFITGTDTGVGKTTVTLALLRAFKQQGFSAAGMKPVAAGCRVTPQGLRSDDAEQLMGEASVALPYDLINPFAYEPPIAPHIAAEQSHRPMAIREILTAYRQVAAQADVVLVEGVGGWAVPINKCQTMADVARALDLPVILVSGIRLGCLNHTLLTYAAIKASGCRCAGWIANLLSDSDWALDQNIAYLKQALPVPNFGVVSYQDRRQPDWLDVRLPEM